MNCDEAAEYVSALCDGVTVPLAAAEHVNVCETCRKRLKEYVELGTEMRRLASLEIAEASLPQFVGAERRNFTATIWQNARKTMRIPRLAFATLLAAVVVLGSGWARQSVQGNQAGSVLMVQFTTGSGPAIFCALSTVKKNLDSCAGLRTIKSGVLLWEVKALSKNGDRALVGVRAAVVPRGPNANTGYVHNLPQQQHELTPGKTLIISVNNFGSMSFSGQWINYIPVISAGSVSQNHDLEPRPNELRFFSPLLLRKNKMIGEMEGASAYVEHRGRAVELYLKGVGRFDISLSHIPGAVRGKVDFNRISFTVDKRSYVFVTGAPVSQSHHVWVLLSPNPIPSSPMENTYLRTLETSKVISTATHT